MGTNDERLSRTAMVAGREAVERMASARVAVFGIGGGGGYAAEALVRSGLGRIDLVDPDVVAPSNLNRQIFATERTLGMRKVDAAEERLRSISPDCTICKHSVLFLPETAAEFRFSEYDYVIDAIDNVTGKVQLVLSAKEAGVPIISSMGTGNKTDPSRLRVSDLFQTSVCPLARVMRHELKKRNVTGLKVVWSDELPVVPQNSADVSETGKPVPGSLAFVPATAGLLMAAEVFRDLCFKPERQNAN